MGVTLPTFTRDASLTVRAAEAAEAAGLDGAFVFDHLWPLGNPHRPALSAFPVLAALAARTTKITLGPLVARVTLLDEDHLIRSFVTLATMMGDGRIVAALGAGDRMSEAENLAYGLRFPGARERVAGVASAANRLHELGLTTWVGGRSAAVRAVAARCADALNSWGSSPSELAAEASDLRAQAGARSVGLTWGGQVLIGRDADDAGERLARIGHRPGLVHGSIEEVAVHFGTLDRMAGGLAWVVCSPLDLFTDPEVALENLARVRHRLALA